MRPLNQSLGLRKHLKGSFLLGWQIGGDVHRSPPLGIFNFLVCHNIRPFIACHI